MGTSKSKQISLTDLSSYLENNPSIDPEKKKDLDQIFFKFLLFNKQEFNKLVNNSSNYKTPLQLLTDHMNALKQYEQFKSQIRGILQRNDLKFENDEMILSNVSNAIEQLKKAQQFMEELKLQAKSNSDKSNKLNKQLVEEINGLRLAEKKYETELEIRKSELEKVKQDAKIEVAQSQTKFQQEYEKLKQQAIDKFNILNQKLTNETNKNAEYETKMKKMEAELISQKQQMALLKQELDSANHELSSFRVTRNLQNTGKVMNSETQILLGKCTKLLASINDKSFDCLMKMENVPDHYIHWITNSIFETLFLNGSNTNTNLTFENLFENSWNKFQSFAESDQMKDEMNEGKRLFSAVVKPIFELFQIVESSGFPKIKLIWFGLNSTNLEMFEVKEKVNLKDGVNLPGTVRTIPVLPALTVGESTTVEKKGAVFIVNYK